MMQLAHAQIIHDIVIENITATGSKTAGVIIGLPESPVKNVVLNNLKLSAEEGLTIEYESPNLAKVHDWAKKQWEQSKHRAISVYAGALGYGYNTDLLKKAGGAEPKCWADLTDPRFHDEVQVADPNSSGTAYTLLATVVQLMGEDKGFDYLKQLHRNVNQYTKSGAAPAKATSLGETLIGITFQHDMVTFIVDGAPIKVVAPCEGTGYEIGSMSIIKGARNLDNAKRWYDWALTAEAQKIGGESKAYQVPSNKDAKPPAQAPGGAGEGVVRDGCTLAAWALYLLWKARQH